MTSGTAIQPRRLDVAPQRFIGWVKSFSDRHGGVTASLTDDGVTLTGPDGAVAQCVAPFPPLPATSGAGADELAELVVDHAMAERTVGVFLVRLGGYAAGVFTGSEPVLAASKVGSRLVHGRSAAGGQSQQRFARRRENQAHQALAAAADTAAAVFGPYQLDALVLGGDKRALRADQGRFEAGPVLRGRRRCVPDRARSPADRAEGHAADVPRDQDHPDRSGEFSLGLDRDRAAGSVDGPNGLLGRGADRGEVERPGRDVDRRAVRRHP